VTNTKKTYRGNKKSIFEEFGKDEIILGVLASMINALRATVQGSSWMAVAAFT
jgi:hypothetical protein